MATREDKDNQSFTQDDDNNWARRVKGVAGEVPFIPLDWDDVVLSEASLTDTWTYKKSTVDIATVVITYSTSLKEKVTRVQRTLI